jgi:ABC-2 type transport system permease protein
LKYDAAIERSYRLMFVSQLGAVVFWIALLLALRRLNLNTAVSGLARYGGDYAHFAVLGVAFSSYLQAGLIVFPQRLRAAQLAGTIETTFMAPVGSFLFVLALGVWDHVVATIRMLAYLLAGVLLLGLDLSGANIAAALLVLLLAVVAFDTLGIISAGIVLVTQRGAGLAPLLAMAASLLSGVYFPVEVLPHPIQTIAMLLPSTYALSTLRLALLGNAGWAEIFPALLALAIFNIVLFPCSLLTVRLAFRHALSAGTLGQY